MEIGPAILAADGVDADRAATATGCDPKHGRRRLIRRLNAVEWEALLSLPLGWTDLNAEGIACGAPVIRRSWRHDAPSRFPEPVRDLVKMLEASAEPVPGPSQRPSRATSRSSTPISARCAPCGRGTVRSRSRWIRTSSSITSRLRRKFGPLLLRSSPPSGPPARQRSGT